MSSATGARTIAQEHFCRYPDCVIVGAPQANEFRIMAPLSELPIKLELQGTNNFRDMGGYPCTDGRKIRQGLLYRSDHLGNLTDEDQLQIKHLNIRTVIDLRRERERADSQDRIDDPAIRQIWLPIDAQGADVHELRRKLESGTMSADNARHHLLEANREFVRDFSSVFRDFLHHLLDADNYPLVFHCTAGKDRAGFAAALFLVTAGASLETVFHDYLSTNQCTADYLDTILQGLRHMPEVKASPEAISTLLRVEIAYLQEAFATIDEVYGSLENFLTTALEMSAEKRAHLRAILCE